MTIFTEEEREALNEVARHPVAPSHPGSEMKLAYPSVSSAAFKGLEMAYEGYRTYLAAVRKAAHTDPTVQHKRALKLADKALGTLVSALAHWKDAERALYY